MHVDIGEHLRSTWLLATRGVHHFSARRLEVITRIRTRPATPL